MKSAAIRSRLKSLVTDRPNLTGYLDGAKAVREDRRSSRVNQIPEAQRRDYMDGFKRGAKHSA